MEYIKRILDPQLPTLLVFNSLRNDKFEFLGMIAGTWRVNSVCFKENNANWFRAEEPELLEIINGLGVDRNSLYCCGHSSGGATAIKVGCLLNVVKVLAFAPQSSLAVDLNRNSGWESEARRLDSTFDYVAFLQAHTRDTRYKVIYCPRRAVDQVHASRYAAISSVEIEAFEVANTEYEHRIPWELKRLGMTRAFFEREFPILKQHAYARISQPSAAPEGPNDSYAMKTTEVASPLETPARLDIASVFRADPGNVGDWHCAPTHYLDFGSQRYVDIFDFRQSAPKLPANIIVGGGGLLGSASFSGCFDKLLAQPFEHIIGWGMGENSKFDAASGYVDRDELSYPEFLKRFSLVGVRDFGTEYPWVPCASCLHPLFADKYNVENEVVVFEHKRVPIAIHGFPKMTNDTNDLASVVQFLGSARVIITNSYHAAYWGQLLGKAVLAFPFSTKFYHFKHKITLCRPGEWKKYLDRVEEQPPVLAECIEANLAHWAKTRDLLNLKTSPAVRTPASRVFLPRPKEIKLESPVAETQMDAVLAELGADDELVILDSENPGFDSLKLSLFERDHIGRDPLTQKQTWRGGKHQRPSCPTMPSGSVFPTVVNFYTIDTPYAEKAKRLKASCDKLGVPCVIEGIANQGSWELNCAFKSRFVLRQWRELGTPVLWLDADAIVHRPPTLLAGNDADFAIHKVDRWEFASGTAYFNQTPNALRLLERWVEKCVQSPNVWDQHCLDSAWEEISCEFPLKTFWLPESYTRIFDRPVNPGEDSAAVIEHFQASRELKPVISNRPPTPVRQFSPEFYKARAVSRPVPKPEIIHPLVPLAPAEKEFAFQLAQFFGSKKVLLIDWLDDRTVRFAPQHYDSVQVPATNLNTNPASPRLPADDGAFDTVTNLGTLAGVSDAALPGWLSELHRVTGRTLWVVVNAEQPRNHAWWKAQFTAAGFCPHPRLSELKPEALPANGLGPVTFVLEKIPAAPVLSKNVAVHAHENPGGGRAVIRLRTAWLLCSNSNHVKLLAPVARQLQAKGWKPTFISLDNFYGQGAARALRELGMDWLQVPTLTPEGNWHERNDQQREPWNAEAAEKVPAMFEASAPQVLVVGNDTGFFEQLFIKTARHFKVRSLLLQEGVLRAPSLNAGAKVMGDGGCDLVCTWGEGWAESLRTRGIRSRIEVVGNPLFDLPLPAATGPVAGQTQIVLLIGQCFGKYGEYTLEQEHAVYEQLVRTILQRPQYRLVFKLHPQQSSKFYSELHQRLGQAFELMTSGESLASIRSADLAVSVASTMALEAFRVGVPTLTLHYLAPFEVPDLIQLPGGCRSEADFCRFLDNPESWKGQRSDPKVDEIVTRRLFYKLDGQACERMTGAIDKLVNQPANLPAARSGSSPAPAKPAASVAPVEEPAATGVELSVILCSYNRAATLIRCLEHFPLQTLPQDKWEVILVNDGSTDNTHELVQQKTWPFPLRYIRQENTGLAGARNAAIAAARGKYLLLINDDTMAAPDLIEKHLVAQKANPHRMVLGAFEYEPWALESAFMQVVNRTTVVFGYPDLTPGATYDHMFSYTCNLSVPAAAYAQAGLFDTSFKSYGAEDTEMGYRLEKAGYLVVYCPEARADHAHALTVDEFVKRQLNVGSNFARFFRIHPEIIRQPRWYRTGEASRFQIECSTEAQEEEMRGCVQTIRDLEIAWKNSGVAQRANIVSQMEPLVKQIAGYYWMAGLGKGMARENLESFWQLPDRRLPMIPGAFSRELESGLALSVILPTYNRLPVLQQCLAALAAQTLPPERFEVLICDDGSTDGTEAFMAGYSAKFRVQYLRDRNQGPGVARNRGIAHAQGKIAVIINDDTILSPAALEQHLACHLQCNGAPMAVMGAYWPSEKGAPSPFQCIVDEIFFSRENMEPNRLHDFRAMWTCNLSLSVQLLRDVGGFDPRFYLAAAEDTDLGIRLAEQFGLKILYRPDIVAYHEHQHTFESFKRSCLVRGRMTYHLVAKHPWLIPQWFNIVEFDGPGIAQFKDFVAKLGVGVAEMEGRMRAVEQFFQAAGPSANPALARQMALQIQPELAKLCFYYYRAGTALELDRQVHFLDARFTENVDYKKFPLRNPWNGRPTLSVVMPVTDTPGLEAAIGGLLRQSLPSWELILADRSRDGRFRVCAKILLQKGFRSHYVHCPTGTEPEAIRAGMEIAQGNLFQVLKPDEALQDNFLQHISHAAQMLTAGIFCPDQTPVGTTPPTVSVVKAVLWKRFFTPDICKANWWEQLCARITRAGFPVAVVPNAVVQLPKAARAVPAATPTGSLEHLLALHLATANWRETVLAKMTSPSPELLTQLRQRVTAAQAGGQAELAARLAQMLHDLETVFPSLKSHAVAGAALELSVIIPTYNRKEQLQRCLDKLACQSLPAAQFEVIVVDDGSSDGTAELLQTQKVPFALRHFSQANKGPAAARNRGIREAAGRVVLFLGDDIYAPADCLEGHLRHHRLFPDDREALLGYIEWAEGLTVTPFMEFITGPAGSQFAFGTIKDHENVDYLYFYTSNISLKKKFLELEQPVFDEGYAHAAYEDTDLGYRLKPRGLHLRHRPQIKVQHDHPTDPERFSQRQFRAGQMAVRFTAKFPETAIAFDTKQCLAANGDAKAYVSDLTLDAKLKAEAARLERVLSGSQPVAPEQKVQLGKIYQQILGRAYARGILSAMDQGNMPVKPPTPSVPEVAIVIPTFNRLDLTRACLKALRENTPLDRCEIIVVDNASTDGTQDFLASEQQQHRLSAILNEKNTGFARACNQGAAAACSRYVLFLNNDTEVKPGWLEPLIRAADADPRIGAMGSKLLFPDGTIQHAGVIIVDDRVNVDSLQARHVFAHQPQDYPEAGRPKTYQALTAACLFVRLEVFKKIGGFDEEFWNGYEDVDLCFRIAAAGSLLVYEPASQVIHYESQSGPERFWLARQNVARLHQKWLGTVQPDFIIGAQGEITAGPANRIADYLPPQTAGATDKPAASIIILVLNQLEHTRACLDSIVAHTPLPHEVIIVDNGSTDGTPEYLKSWQAAHANCTVIRNESNRGFAGGNNQGLAVARGEQVVLLNNDTVVTDGWLEAMLAVITRYPDTGLVGPASNRVSGPQLVREAAYKNMAEMHEFARNFARANAGKSFEVVRAVGFCLLATRAVIAKIGGLDEGFGSGNFEDDDFCLRAQLAGFRTRIACDSFVHHTGSQTFAGQKIDYRVSMQRNWDIFRTKWQLPVEATLEHGYPIPKQLPPGLALNLPLPKLATSHNQDGNHWTEKKKISPVAMPIKPAPVAEIGRLDEARQLFGQKNLEAAWSSTLTAIAKRPFHPAAFMLLAEIALAAGAGRLAKQCAQHARDFAPAWTPVKQFLCKPLKGDAKQPWLVLPEELRQPPYATRSRVSVCLIVKNEERFLAQCLKSLRGLATQMVVVDTGSTDRTVEIAREFGAEIYSFPWCDDFAAARNAALEHATGDWILIMDADEELPTAEHAKLREDMKSAKSIGYRLPLVNAGNENEGRSFIPRLFRNAPEVFFHGRIHEQVFPSLLAPAKKWGLKTALGTAEILHHGYTKELVRDRNKVERNLKLLRAAIVENPADANLLMNLGLELVRSDELAAGIEKYREAYDLMSAQPEADLVPELREVLLTQFTSQLYKVRNHEEVVRVLNSPLAQHGGLTASLHFALGLAYFELKQFSEAAAQMRQCLSKRKQPGLTPINTDILTAAPQHCLALCLMKLGELPAAEKAFAAALTETGHVEAATLDYARFLRDVNRPVDALKQLHGLVTANTGNVSAWCLGGEIALGSPDFLEFGRDWTGEAFKALPENPIIATQRAEVLMLNSDPFTAMPLWENIWSSEHEPRTLAALILCEIAAGRHAHAPNPGPDEQATSRAFVEWYQRLIAMRSKTLIEMVNGRLDRLALTLPSAAQMLQTALSEANTPVGV